MTQLDDRFQAGPETSLLDNVLTAFSILGVDRLHNALLRRVLSDIDPSWRGGGKVLRRRLSEHGLVPVHAAPALSQRKFYRLVDVVRAAERPTTEHLQPPLLAEISELLDAHPASSLPRDIVKIGLHYARPTLRKVGLAPEEPRSHNAGTMKRRHAELDRRIARLPMQVETFRPARGSVDVVPEVPPRSLIVDQRWRKVPPGPGRRVTQPSVVAVVLGAERDPTVSSGLAQRNARPEAVGTPPLTLLVLARHGSDKAAHEYGQRTRPEPHALASKDSHHRCSIEVANRESGRRDKSPRPDSTRLWIR
ncbi:hypothetical protein [Qaidamihabitans albus]|uniref:hypothetical protein n=1 Tax=Qaidamihabitans albus TaxID=2795733 RepID=UPI0018F1CF3C|nr:hypothetical protein [Qaidamihabitans albus]